MINQNDLFRKHHVKNRIDKLFNNDDIRLHRILEMIQYVIIYFFIGSFFCYILNNNYFPFLPSNGFWRNYWELLGLLIIYTILIFYLLKLVKCIPIFYQNNHKFIPYQTNAYNAGGLALVLAFCTLNKNYIDRVIYLRDKFPSI